MKKSEKQEFSVKCFDEIKKLKIDKLETKGEWIVCPASFSQKLIIDMTFCDMQKLKELLKEDGII